MARGVYWKISIMSVTVISVLQIGDIHYPQLKDLPSSIDHKDLGVSPNIVEAVSLPPLQSLIRTLQRVIAKDGIDCRLDNFQAEVGLLLRFREVGQSGRRRMHDMALDQWLRERTNQYMKVRKIRSISEDEMFAELRSVSRRIYRRLKRPFTIFLDASCFPKVYLLSFLAFGFRCGLFRAVYIFYAQAEYSLDTIEAILERRIPKSYRFTEGEWRGVEVPYLEESINAGQERNILVALGFEGGKSYRFIKGYDPDRVTAIICDPGFTPEYTQIAQEENRFIINSLELDETDIIKIGAGDMVSVFRFADHYAGQVVGNVALTFYGLGTKPHAIGLGLASIVAENVPMIARLPQRFVETKTMSSGTSWLYTIRDLSVF